MAQKGVPMNNQRLGDSIWAKTPRVVSEINYRRCDSWVQVVHFVLLSECRASHPHIRVIDYTGIFLPLFIH